MKRRKINFKSKEEWLNLRKNYIGASEVSILTGNNPYQTELDLYNNKINGYETPITERMIWGNVLEDSIAREWARRNERKIRKSNYLFVYDDYLSATIDRRDDFGRIIEIKNMSSFSFNNSKKINGVPAMYYDQMQAQFLCVGVSEGVFVALINNGELFEIGVDYNEDYAMSIYEKVKEFIENHIIKKIPPTTPQINTSIETELFEEIIEADNDDLNIYDKILTLNNAIKELEDEKTNYINQIKSKMGNKKEVIYNGKKLFYYSSFTRFNSTKFKKENPDLYESYKEVSIKFNINYK